MQKHLKSLPRHKFKGILANDKNCMRMEPISDYSIMQKKETNNQSQFNPDVDENNESTSPIFKLPIDCFVEIFEWLSLPDLQAVGQTCKWLHAVAGTYFRTNYSAAPIGCASNGIYLNGIKLNAFSEFIGSASILLYRIDDGRFQYLNSKCSNDAFKQLRLIFVNLTASNRDHIENVLKKIEVLEVSHCKVDDKFSSDFLSLCVNLTRLCVRNCENTESSNEQWLLQKHPKLEHLEWVDDEKDIKNEQLEIFFEQNRNLRSFATSASILWDLRHSMDVKLDDLAIDIDHFAATDLISIIELLYELHQRGVYQWLHLYTTSLQLSQTSVDNLAHLHGLVKIYLRNISHDVSFFPLVNLKEFGIYLCSSFTACDKIARDSVNLERLYFWKAGIYNLVPFLRYSAKLKKIKVQHFEPGENFASILTTINAERANLSRAQKVTIYLDENIYLDFKWTTNSSDLGFIRIKRAESFEWQHHFGY